MVQVGTPTAYAECQIRSMTSGVLGCSYLIFDTLRGSVEGRDEVPGASTSSSTVVTSVFGTAIPGVHSLRDCSGLIVLLISRICNLGRQLVSAPNNAKGQDKTSRLEVTILPLPDSTSPSTSTRPFAAAALFSLPCVLGHSSESLSIHISQVSLDTLRGC